MMLIGYGVFVRILRTAWASALLVTDYLGDARASIRGTSNRQTPTLFCILAANVLTNKEPELGR